MAKKKTTTKKTTPKSSKKKTTTKKTTPKSSKKKTTTKKTTTKKTTSKPTTSKGDVPPWVPKLIVGDMLATSDSAKALFKVVDVFAKQSPHDFRVQRVGGDAGGYDRRQLTKEQVANEFVTLPELTMSTEGRVRIDEWPIAFDVKIEPKTKIVDMDTGERGAIVRTDQNAVIVRMDGATDDTLIPWTSKRFWPYKAKPRSTSGKGKGVVATKVERRKTTSAQVKIENAGQVRERIRKLTSRLDALSTESKGVKAELKRANKALNEVLDDGTLPLWDKDGAILEYEDGDE